VTLESARLRLLGGIALNELRLARRDDADQPEIAYLPSGVLYHDKEHLLGGKLFIRKVELHRPRLRLVRNREGRWNFAGIAQTEKAEGPFPTLVVRQGSIVLEDQFTCPEGPPLEITDVNLTVLPDPPGTLTIEGSGRSDLVGPVRLRGSWQRPGGELTLSVRAARVPVGPPLLRRLRTICPETAEHLRHLEAEAAFEGEFAYRPGSARPWQHDLRCRLSGGKFRHKALPLRLEQLEAALHCRDGKWVVEQLTARAGPTCLRLTESWVRPTPEGLECQMCGEVEHLPVGHDLFTRLPAELRPFENMYHPDGPATVAFRIARQHGRWQEQHWAIRPEGLGGYFHLFPYSLARVRGLLDADLLRHFIRVDLTGYTGPRPVTIQGTWQGKGTDAAGDLTIRGKDIPLDRKLLVALPPAFQKLARSFHLSGLGDFTIHVGHTPGIPSLDYRYLVRIHHGQLNWDEFPYPLQQVAGTLDIVPDHWELRGFRGRNQGGEFGASGRSYPAPPGHPASDARVAVRITGKDVRIDGRDMQHALSPFAGLSKAWHSLRPAGRMNFIASIDRLPRQPQDLDVTVDVKACAVHPLFFKYRLNDLKGRFRYFRNHVTLDQVSAHHGKTLVELPHGQIKLNPAGGLYAELTDLRADPLLPDADLRRALPEGLKKVCEALHLQDPLALKTQLVIALGGEPASPPDIYWNAKLWLRDGGLRVGIPVDHVSGCFGCVGRQNGNQLLGVNGHLLLDQATLYQQPFRKVHAKIDIFEDAPDVLVLHLKAPLFGGVISGPGRLEMSSTMRYELDLTASEINLEKFSKHNLGGDSALSGLVGGRLHLVGTGSGLSNLEAHGNLDMPKGHVYNLPLVLDLLKFLGLRWPDRTAFDQAHAAFSVHGDRVHLSQLELFGNAVSLHGTGDMRLNGTDIKLDFIPVWGRIEQVLPAVWNDIPSAIGKNLLKIEMRGGMGPGQELKFHKKLVPGLVEPLQQIGDKLTSTLAPKPPQESSSGGR
jgi:hypothetical protein